jgi:hypothetical protein
MKSTWAGLLPLKELKMGERRFVGYLWLFVEAATVFKRNNEVKQSIFFSITFVP